MRTRETSPVGLVQAGLAALTAVDVVELPDEQVRQEVLALLTCLNQLTGALADRIGTFDARDLARADGQRVSTTWLTGFGRMSKGAALRWLVHARYLRQLPALAAGLRAGTVSVEQLDKICDLIRAIGIDTVRGYDEILAVLCQTGDPKQVEQACARIHAWEDPDGAEPDPEKDFARREIIFSQLGSMMYIRGRLDPDGAAVLRSAVEALMRPPKVFDDRGPAQRRADALVDLARGALAGEHLPTVGGERPHVGLLLTPQILVGTPTGTGTGHPHGTDPGCPHGTVGDGDCPQQTDPPTPVTTPETSTEVTTRQTSDQVGDDASRAGTSRRLAPSRRWCPGQVRPAASVGVIR